MNEMVKTDAQEIMEAVISKGDLSKLTPAERNTYYDQTCRSVGLNPLTRPFEYITLQGKMTLYARRDAADQLRKLHGISIKIVDRELKDGIFTVHVHASTKDGREDEDFGSVAMPGGAAEIRANLTMKATTKAKRRVTLSICGLGFPDESEIEDIAREEKKTSRKVQTITSQPTEIPPPDQPAEPAASLDAPQEPPQGEAAVNLSQPAQMYAAQLGTAARKGMSELQAMWEKLHPRYQKELKHHLEKVLKPQALLIDKGNGLI